MKSKPGETAARPNRSTDRYLVPIVAKTIDLLDCFSAEDESLTLKEIIQRTALPHTTAYRILHTLVSRDYLKQNGHLYRLNKMRRRPKFAFANLSTKISLAVEIEKSLRNAATAAGVDLEIWDNDRDAEKAIKNAEAIAERKPDIVIEFQLFEQVAPIISDVFSRAHIPVISVVNPHHGSLYLGVDNYRAGFTAGVALAEHAARYWGGKINALLLLESPPAGRTVQSRLVGAWRGLESKLGGLAPKSVQHVDSGGNRETAMKAVQAFLNKHSARNILIAAINDETALGAAEAAVHKQNGRNIAIVGHGGSPEMCNVVADPKSPCIGTVSFRPEVYGPELVSFGLRVLRERSSLPAHYIAHEFLSKDWLMSRRKAS
ncbi:MAG TPA: substrate-binding domain-containing protein [Terriglobales bacterium]|nr:substrate-binding domain-containing protein [Terriglobales bacterium]